MREFQHITKHISVDEDEATDYAMEQLGITIKPKGKYGTYTQEQVDFMVEFTEWYFSGMWVLEEKKEVVCNEYISKNK